LGASRAFTSASLANCNICRLPVAPCGRFLSQQIYCNCLRAGFRSIPGAKSVYIRNEQLENLFFSFLIQLFTFKIYTLTPIKVISSTCSLSPIQFFKVEAIFIFCSFIGNPEIEIKNSFNCLYINFLPLSPPN